VVGDCRGRESQSPAIPNACVEARERTPLLSFAALVNPPFAPCHPPALSRREFLVGSAAALACTQLAHAAATPEPIIDIHQHTNYGGKRDSAYLQVLAGRTDEQLRIHQRGMGVTKSILLPRAGR
jgi:hypothetical protein